MQPVVAHDEVFPIAELIVLVVAVQNAVRIKIGILLGELLAVSDNVTVDDVKDIPGLADYALDEIVIVGLLSVAVQHNDVAVIGRKEDGAEAERLVS